MLNSEASQELHRLRAALEDCLIADMNGLRAIGLRLGRLADEVEGADDAALSKIASGFWDKWEGTDDH